MGKFQSKHGEMRGGGQTGGRAGARRPLTVPSLSPRPPAAPQPLQPSSGERAPKVSARGGGQGARLPPGLGPEHRARRAFCRRGRVWCGGRGRGTLPWGLRERTGFPAPDRDPGPPPEPRAPGRAARGGRAWRRGIVRAQLPRAYRASPSLLGAPFPARPPTGPQGTASWCLRTWVAAEALRRRSGGAAWSTAQGTSR